MEFLKRCENAIVNAENKINKKMIAAYAGGVFAVSTCLGSVNAFAADITSFGETIAEIILEVYQASIGVVSVLTALLLIFAFIIRMTGNQQKAQQATSWIIRIIVCYIAINCIGLMLTVIDSTTQGHSFDDYNKPQIEDTELPSID